MIIFLSINLNKDSSLTRLISTTERFFSQNHQNKQNDKIKGFCNLEGN